jgi:hypothetical protein
VMRGDEWPGNVVEARPVKQGPATEHEEQIEQLSMGQIAGQSDEGEGGTCKNGLRRLQQ